MKKIIAIVLCVLAITFLFIGCKKEEKPDPYEEWYGTYTMVEDGTEFYHNGKQIQGGVPYEVTVYTGNIISQTGNTIEITKGKIKFSGGSIEAEFEYYVTYAEFINFDSEIENGYFPFNRVTIESFEIITPTKYQAVTSRVLKLDEKFYIIYFYYSKQ